MSFPPHHSQRTLFSEPPKNTQEELQLLKKRTPGRRIGVFQAKCGSCPDDPTRGLLDEGDCHITRDDPQDEDQSNSQQVRHQAGGQGEPTRARLPTKEAPNSLISGPWGSISKVTVKSMTDGDDGYFYNNKSVRESNSTFTKKQIELEENKCKGYCCCCMHKFTEGEQIHEEKFCGNKLPVLWCWEQEGEQFSFRVNMDEDTMLSAVLVCFIGFLVSLTYITANSCVPACLL